VTVIWGAPGDDRAIVYLHGRCGEPRAVEAWARAASAYGTVLALRGDIDCPSPGRARWGLDPEALEGRLLAALASASDARGTPLQHDEITVVGYSQGAARAEALAAASPARFSRLVLVSGPDAPAPANVATARSIALLAGERDRRRHIEQAFARLLADGFPVRYWMLPSARHGEYGPRSEAVFADVFAWLFSDGFSSP
jgi:predicted esterase